MQWERTSEAERIELCVFFRFDYKILLLGSGTPSLTLLCSVGVAKDCRHVGEISRVF